MEVVYSVCNGGTSDSGADNHSLDVHEVEPGKATPASGADELEYLYEADDEIEGEDQEDVCRSTDRHSGLFGLDFRRDTIFGEHELCRSVIYKDIIDERLYCISDAENV